jgi:Flp pilus assembly protein TadD
MAQWDGDDLITRQKLAQLALAAKDYPAAQRWATEAIQIDVLDVEMHRLLGESLAEQNKYDQAIKEFEVAIQLKPRQLHLRFALADAYVQTGQQDKARTALRQLLELDPEYPGADVLLESLDK